MGFIGWQLLVWRRDEHGWRTQFRYEADRLPHWCHRFIAANQKPDSQTQVIAMRCLRFFGASYKSLIVSWQYAWLERSN